MTSPDSSSSLGLPSQPLFFDQARQVLYIAGDIALGNGQHHSDMVRAHIGEHLGRMMSLVDSAEADSAQIMGAFPVDEIPTITIDGILSGARARNEEIIQEETAGYELPVNPFLIRDDEHLAIIALELYVQAADREVR
jgi:hypothetical protein